jgi:hypothetical protein
MAPVLRFHFREPCGGRNSTSAPGAGALVLVLVG